MASSATHSQQDDNLRSILLLLVLLEVTIYAFKQMLSADELLHIHSRDLIISPMLRSLRKARIRSRHNSQVTEVQSKRRLVRFERALYLPNSLLGTYASDSFLCLLSE